MTNSFHGNQLAAAMMLRGQGLAPNMPGSSSLARRMSAATGDAGGQGLGNSYDPADVSGRYSPQDYVPPNLGDTFDSTPPPAAYDGGRIPNIAFPRLDQGITFNDVQPSSTTDYAQPTSSGRPWYGRLAEGAIMASPLGPLYGLYKLLHGSSGPGGGMAIPRAPQNVVTFPDSDGSPTDSPSPGGQGLGSSFVFNPGGGAPNLWQSSRGSSFLPGGSYGYSPMGGSQVYGNPAGLGSSLLAYTLSHHRR